MKILHSGNECVVDDKYIDYSPYLSTLRDTDVGKDVDEKGYIIIEQDLTDYIVFLETGNVNKYDRDLYDFMGHENIHNYPDDFYIVRLEDRWIRDNMYKYGLIENKLYGLIEVKSNIDGRYKYRLDKIKSMFKGCKPIIAGGMALYLLGGATTFCDIDVFFTFDDCDRVEEIIESNKCVFKPGNNCVTNIEHGYQVIFRKYRSISEIVHGFDIDCCGFLLYEDKIYSTKRALYSMNNKVNWFDPDRMSPSYVYRLCKYARRGYSIELPSINMRNFNLDMFSRSILNELDTYVVDIEGDIIDTKSHIQYHDYIAKLGFEPTLARILLMYNIIVKHKQTLYSRSYNRVDKGKQVNMLFIAKFMHLYPTLRSLKSDDYDGGYYSDDSYIPYTLPDWIEQDPMKQITTTFNPQPIDDIHDYYSKSDYYIPNDIL